MLNRLRKKGQFRLVCLGNMTFLRLTCSNIVKSLVEIGYYVVDVLHADGQPYGRGGDVLLFKFFMSHLRVRSRGWMDHQAFYIRDIGKQGEYLQAVYELPGVVLITFDLESEYRASSIREVLIVKGVAGMALD